MAKLSDHSTKFKSAQLIIVEAATRLSAFGRLTTPTVLGLQGASGASRWLAFAGKRKDYTYFDWTACMKVPYSLYIENIMRTLFPSRRAGAQAYSLKRARGTTRTSFCPNIELLEDRCTPSLIGDQILPILVPNVPIVVPAATINTVTVLAPALSSTPTGQLITLTDTISGAPTGGTVTFSVGGFILAANVPVVNGTAQIVIPLAPGTPDGAVTATYTGTTGFTGSTSSGAGNGTLAFCTKNGSTELGLDLRTFAVLAAETVTNTGATVIIGNVGVSPGSAVDGFPPGDVTGTIYSAGHDPTTAVPIRAQTQLTTAFTNLAGLAATPIVGGQLGGLTLTPGVYSFSSTANLTGTLTLDAQNDPDALFVFQIGSTLTTGSASRVLFINGGPDNLYWVVGSSATLGTTTEFAGNILAQISIGLRTGATIACGRVLARTGEVTLDTNFIDPVPHQHPDAEHQAALSQLRLDHGFYFNGSYHQNTHGANEKWFLDRANQWWALTTGGNLIKWDGISFASSTQNAATTVHVGTNVFDDPSLLLNADIASPALLAQLSDLQMDHGFHFDRSYFQSTHGANEKWFLDRNNQWWALTTDGDLVKWDGVSFASSVQNAATTVHVGRAVYDDPSLLHNAIVVSPASLLAQLSDLQLENRFHFNGNYFQSTHGANEKWFLDRNNHWWALTTDGDLVKWDGISFASSVQSATTVHVGRTVFDDPSLLLNASVA